MCKRFRFINTISRDNSEIIFDAIVSRKETEIYWIDKNGISCYTSISTKKLKENLENGTWKKYDEYKEVAVC